MKRAVVPVVILLLLGAAAFVMFRGEERKYLTANFDRTVAIYEGSEVRVLGVPVGEVESVEPAGTEVKVRLSYDADVTLPADVRAVIITPSVVGDRFVQLSPVYTGGDQLADNAHVEQTEMPLELDEIYDNIDKLTVALGPDGANSEGALSELLQVGADNLEGQGEEINQTLRDLGRFTGTLENNKDDLFGAAEELQRFISTLEENDDLVRDFNASVEKVSDMLAGEREELSESLQYLGGALVAVRDFVRDNEDLLGTNIKGLNKIAKVLVKRRGELDEILKAGPVALNNLALTYNPQAGTLDVSANLENAAHVLVNNPSLFLCSVVGTADPTGVVCALIEGLLGKNRAAVAAGATPAKPDLAAVLGVER